MDREFRCTRNAPYSHQCLGHDDLSCREGYYINASSQEEAWEKMACQFPEETSAGFTIHEWQGFNVTVDEVRPEG